MENELQRAVALSKGKLERDLETALLFEVNAGELAWSYTFLSQPWRPLLKQVHAACLELGRAFDRNHAGWR